MSPQDTLPIALVLGFGLPGLAIARALHRAGVEVHAVSHSADVPAVHTRFAEVHVREGVNSSAVIGILEDFAEQHLRQRRAVVFPTSDRIVEALAVNWDRVNDAYLLSWAGCRDLVQSLLRKDQLPGYCARQNVNHPLSLVVAGEDQLDVLPSQLAVPFLVKPARPQSGFKSAVVRRMDELRALMQRHAKDLPFVVQQWIEGGDERLWSCTMYLDQGRALAVACGRKIRSQPPGTGQGVIVETMDDDEVIAQAHRFVRGMPLRGPIAIEFKRDAAGKLWLIEPNVGRMEYCVDLAIQQGINLPLVEYRNVVGVTDPVPDSPPVQAVRWYDTEKDPLCYLRECLQGRSLRPDSKKPVFPYWGHRDSGPWLAAWRVLSRRLVGSLLTRLGRSQTSKPS